MISRLFLLVSMVLLGTLSVLAHHPFSAEFDWKRPVTVVGTVTKVDWSNPHAHIYVDGKGLDGKAQNWTFELGSLSALSKAGWTKTTVKMGDTVTVDAWLSRSSNSAGNVKSVTLSNGRELSGASSIGDPAPAETKKSTANY